MSIFNDVKKIISCLKLIKFQIKLKKKKERGYLEEL